MLDKRFDRSYLFGRLLGMIERVEQEGHRYRLIRKSYGSVSLIEKHKTAYQKRPASTLFLLMKASNPTLLKLIEIDYLYFMELESEMKEALHLLEKHHLFCDDFNTPLNFHFVFGYYSERRI